MYNEITPSLLCCGNQTNWTLFELYVQKPFQLYYDKG